MGAYGVLNISFPPPVCQPLLLLLPSPGWHTLRRSDNVISRKSEILLASDVRISHSIPPHPNIHAFSPLPLPHLTFVGRLLKGKRCFVVEVCVCVLEKRWGRNQCLWQVCPHIKERQRGRSVIGRYACVSEVNGSFEG